MGLFPRSIVAAILTAGCYLSIATVNVLAQSPRPGPSTSALGLSDQKLSAVAAARERVASRQQDYRQRIAETEAPADKERIVAEANVELTKAVTEQGVSVEEYTSILNVARDVKFGVKFFSTFIARTNSGDGTKRPPGKHCQPAGLSLAALPHMFGKHRGELAATMVGAKKDGNVIETRFEGVNTAVSAGHMNSVATLSELLNQGRSPMSRGFCALLIRTAISAPRIG